MLSNQDNRHGDSHQLVDANGCWRVQSEYPTQLSAPSCGSVGCFKFWCAPLQSCKLHMSVVMSFTFEVSGNWCDLSIFLDSGFMFINPLTKCSCCLSDVIFVAFSTRN